MNKILFLLMLLVSPVCFSAGFDCGKAKDKIEMMICSNIDASNYDEYFSEFCSSVFKNLIDKEKEILRKQQIEWLKNVRSKCETVDCLVSTYEKRENEINEWIKSKKPAPLESETLSTPFTDRQEVWKELEPKSRKTEEALEMSYRRQLKEAYFGRNVNNAGKKLAEAKKSWEVYREKYCDSISTIYGGMWAGIHEIECKIEQAEMFIKMNEKHNY